MNRTIEIGSYAFDEAKHLHTLDGKPLTGVTTVLGVIAKPMLIQWAANMACSHISDNFPTAEEVLANPKAITELIEEARTAHRKKKESAGEAGTKVHADIEEFIKNFIQLNQQVYVWSDTGNFSLDNFGKWAAHNSVKFLASEKHVHSKDMWIGGIADFICEIDGKRYVGDVKTSSGIYPEHFIQCCAYAACLEEMGEKPFDGIVIVNCKKDGGFDTQMFYNIEEGVKAFKAALTLYRFLEATKK